MTDFAAAPAQPIVQGLIRATNLDGSGVVSFFGIGIVQTGPFAPVYNGVGNYTLTLDPGLPGDVAIDPPFARFLMTVRALAGTPTLVVAKSIAYITSPAGSAAAIGANQIQISLTTDPEVALEIILWRGDAGVELTNLNIIGPLFAPQGLAVP